MSWKLRPLVKENCHCVSPIETPFINYDLISICETSLNDSVELHETLLDEYTFVHANNPANTRRGGVELKFDRKIYFLLFCIDVLPTITTLLIFKVSWQILENLHVNIKGIGDWTYPVISSRF